jgi:hypothetical protein
MSDANKGRQPGPNRGKDEVLFEDDTLFEQFLTEAQDHVPSEETLGLIYQRVVAEGQLHPEKIDAAWEQLLAQVSEDAQSSRQSSTVSTSVFEATAKTAWFYTEFLIEREGKSLQAVAAELGITLADLSLLQQSQTLIEESSLLKFCREFTQAHPQFTVSKLKRLLKRALVLFSMTQDSDRAMLKAARKKKE